MKASTRDLRQRIAILDTIDRTTYEKTKDSLQVNIDVPFQWSTTDSYDTFRTKLDTFKQDHHYNFDVSERVGTIEAFLSPDGHRVVEACISALLQSQKSGLYPYVTRSTGDTVGLTVYYRAVDPGARPLPIGKSQITNGFVSDRLGQDRRRLWSAADAPLKPNASRSVIITRSPANRALMASLDAGDYSFVVDVPPVAATGASGVAQRKELLRLSVSGNADVTIQNHPGPIAIPRAPDDHASLLQLPLHVESSQSAYTVRLAFYVETANGANNSAILAIRRANGDVVACPTYTPPPKRDDEHCSYGHAYQPDTYSFDDTFEVVGLEPGNYIVTGEQYLGGGGTSTVTRTFKGLRLLTITQSR